MEQEIIFTLVIDAQEIVVRYRPHYLMEVGYAHFAFTSPHNPPRRIPVSATGYRSHFAPLHAVSEAASVEDYARAAALAIMAADLLGGNRDNDDYGQLDLFSPTFP